MCSRRRTLTSSKLKRVGTRLLGARDAVAFSQAQELLRLPQLRPGLDSTEQLLGEIAEIGSEKTRLLDDALGAAQCVRSAFGWIVSRIGRPSTFGLAHVYPDQHGTVIEPHQLPIATDFDTGARRATAQRVPSRAPIGS